MTSRRNSAHTSRQTGRPSSIALCSDDLGLLREHAEETDIDILRRQLIESDRLNDALKSQVQALQLALSQRPSLEGVNELEKERKELDLLLAGTLRENERGMADLARSKEREKMLERELAKFAGENWQTTLGIAPIPVMTSPVLRFSAQNQAVLNTQTPMPASGASTVDSAYIEQIRFLIMGMEEHLIQREAKLKATVARAEKEIKRADDMKNEILSQ